MDRKTVSSTRVRKAVITYIFGGYDTLKDPAVLTPGWDYLCYSDAGLGSAVWQPVRPDAELASITCPKRRSSALKIGHHRHAPDTYDLIITLDGSMKINCNLDDFLAEFCGGACDFAIARHPKRDCLYDEANAILDYRLDDAAVVRGQIARYRAEGFPIRQGLYGARMTIKSQRSPELREVCELWYGEYFAGSRRDQLSLPYALWKHARETGRTLRMTAFDFEEVYRTRRLFEITPHLGSHDVGQTTSTDYPPRS